MTPRKMISSTKTPTKPCTSFENVSDDSVPADEFIRCTRNRFHTINITKTVAAIAMLRRSNEETPSQDRGAAGRCHAIHMRTAPSQRAVRAQGRADSGSTPNFQTTTTNKVQTIPKTAKKIATSPSEGGAGCGVVVETAVTGTPSNRR